MTPDKARLYNNLVLKRQGCRLCKESLHKGELTNPANTGFDTNEIGPWSAWQGNLDAELLIVGQDWGYIETFVDYEGKNEPSLDRYQFPTDENLVEFLDMIGVNIGHPLKPRTDMPVFLTNAVLCLKAKRVGKKVRDEWWRNCGREFLKPLITIVKPKVVVALGGVARTAVMTAYGKPVGGTLGDAVRSQPIRLDVNVDLLSVYHPSPEGMITHKRTEHIQAWRRVGKFLGTI